MTGSVFGTPDAEGWYEWKGDDMVRPAGRVEVIYRTNVGADKAPASAFFWGHSGLACDIAKWRPAYRPCATDGCLSARGMTHYCDKCERDL